MRKLAAMRTKWHGVDKLAAVFIDDGNEVRRRPDIRGAAIDALQPVDRAMTFRDALVRKTRALKLAIDIAGEHERAVLHVRDAHCSSMRKPPCDRVARYIASRCP